MAPIQTLTGVNVYFFTLLLLQLQVDDVLPSYFRAERMKEGARSTYCTLAFVSLQHNPSTIDLPLPDAKQEKKLGGGLAGSQLLLSRSRSSSEVVRQS